MSILVNSASFDKTRERSQRRKHKVIDRRKFLGLLLIIISIVGMGFTSLGIGAHAANSLTTEPNGTVSKPEAASTPTGRVSPLTTSTSPTSAFATPQPGRCKPAQNIVTSPFITQFFGQPAESNCGHQPWLSGADVGSDSLVSGVRATISFSIPSPNVIQADNQLGAGLAVNGQSNYPECYVSCVGRDYVFYGFVDVDHNGKISLVSSAWITCEWNPCALFQGLSCQVFGCTPADFTSVSSCFTGQNNWSTCHGYTHWQLFSDVFPCNDCSLSDTFVVEMQWVGSSSTGYTVLWNYFRNGILWHRFTSSPPASWKLQTIFHSGHGQWAHFQWGVTSLYNIGTAGWQATIGSPEWSDGKNWNLIASANAYQGDAAYIDAIYAIGGLQYNGVSVTSSSTPCSTQSTFSYTGTTTASSTALWSGVTGTGCPTIPVESNSAQFNSGTSSFAPSITTQSRSFTLTVAQDAYTNTLGSGINHGAETTVQVGLTSNTATTYERDGYLFFNLPTLPSGSVITAATLSVQLQLNSGTNSINLLICPASKSWSETTITALDNVGCAVSGITFSNAGTTSSFDITSIINGVYAGSYSNYGLVIIPGGTPSSTNKNGPNNYYDFYAIESGHPATLAMSASIPPPSSGLCTGQVANVLLTFTNTGGSTWNPSGPYNYYLASQNSPSNIWGLSQVSLGSPISHGGAYTFSFAITAPSTPGNYYLRWQMYEAGQGLGWFGDISPPVYVNVMSCYLSLSASPSTVPVGGPSSTLTVQISSGDSGIPVSFTTTLGSLSASACTTGSTGSCTVTISSSSMGVATITATASGYGSGQTTVTFTPGYVSAQFTSESGMVTGSQVYVLVNNPISLSLTVSSSTTLSGTLSVDIRENIVSSNDVTFQTLSQSVSLNSGNNIVNLGSFTPTVLTGTCSGCVFQFYVRVSWNNVVFYNPTDPNAREWVKTTASDFSLAPNASSFTVVAGSSGTLVVTLTSQSGYAGTVSLMVYISPAVNTNITVGFSPTVISLSSGGTGSSTATIYTASDTPLGSYTVTLIGTDGTLSRQSQITVMITNFSISASPSAMNFPQGGSGSSTMTLTSLGGFSGSVSLSSSAIPTGPTASLSPATTNVASGGQATSTLLVTTSSSTPAGNYTFMVNATIGASQRTVTVIVVVTATDFSVIASPATQTVSVGSNAISAVTVNPINGFVGTVNLSTSSPGASCSLTPASVSLSNSVGTATLSCSSSTSGEYSAVISGATSGITHSTSVLLIVGLSLYFRDNFTYSSTSQMTTAGWSLSTPAQSSIGGGLLTLINNQQAGSQATWTNVPAGLGNWTIALGAEWVGQSAGTFQLNAWTAKHSYIWHADGWPSFTPQYILYRDGQILTKVNGYTPQLNVWHTLRMDMRGSVLSLYFDGKLITTYTETDPGTTLTQFGPAAGYGSTDSFNFVEASGFSFHDDFTYISISAMSSAGWSVSTPTGYSGYATVSGGLLTLVNDGTRAASATWTSVPSGVADWTISAGEEWVGGSYGTLQLNAWTAKHSYVWHADGYPTYLQYILYRDGQFVRQINGYSPQLNVWHTLRIDMRGGVLSLYFDGSLITTYTETDPLTSLTQFGPAEGWMSTVSIDFIQAARVDTSRFDFGLSTSPTSVSFNSGSSASSTLSLNSLTGSSATVSLVALVLSTALTISFSPPVISVPSNGTTSSKITFSSSTKGTYYVTLTASDGIQFHSTTLVVTVQ